MTETARISERLEEIQPQIAVCRLDRAVFGLEGFVLLLRQMKERPAADAAVHTAAERQRGFEGGHEAACQQGENQLVGDLLRFACGNHVAGGHLRVELEEQRGQHIVG